MNLLRAATLVVDDPKDSAARYVRWFEYTVVERGFIDDALAISWGAPASAGKAYTLCRPASGADIMLRFVAGDTPASFQPLRTFGWAALELCVSDVEAVNARVLDSPFEVIGPPRLLDTMPEIYPMQVRGPDQEIVYLTEIRGDQKGVKLPRAACLVDHLFILVLGCSDIAASSDWFRNILGIHIGMDVAITYSMLAKAYDLPLEQKHRIMTGVHGTDCFLEFDQYPQAAIPRPVANGQLPPGIAMATFALPNISDNSIAPPTRHEGRLYAGARSIALQGPDGVLIEIVERV